VPKPSRRRREKEDRERREVNRGGRGWGPGERGSGERRTRNRGRKRNGTWGVGVEAGEGSRRRPGASEVDERREGGGRWEREEAAGVCVVYYRENSNFHISTFAKI